MVFATQNGDGGGTPPRHPGEDEPHYQLLVTVPEGKSFRVYMNAPGQKKTALKNQIVSRNEFPRAIFSTP